VDGSTEVGWLKKSLIFWRAHAGDAVGGWCLKMSAWVVYWG